MSKLLDLALETIRTRRQEFEERFGVRLIGVNSGDTPMPLRRE